MSEIPIVARRFPGLVVFNNRDFVFFSCARLFATTAFQMEIVAVSWMVYQFTHSTFALGLVGLAGFLPGLLFSLVTGHVADIFDRRLILITCYSGFCLVAAGLIAFVASGTHQVWPVYILIFGIGTARAFSGPAGQALLPNLVARENFTHAIAWNSSFFQTATIVGPALGGVLYVFGGMVVFATSTVFFAASVLSLFFIKPHPREGTAEKANWQRLIAGIGYIRSRPTIMGAISLDLFAVLLGGATALMPVYAQDILHTGPWGLGVMRSAPAVGAVLIAVMLARWPIERRVGAKMFYAVFIFGLATLGFGLSRNLYFSLLCLFILGAADMISVIIRQTLVQIETPDAMRGRVAAVNMVFIGASNELGEFESGTVAALLGTVASVSLGGIGTLIVAGLWIRWFPKLWARDKFIE